MHLFTVVMYYVLFVEVMQRELDKIERFANKIVGQSHLSAPAAQKLLKEVKVAEF